MLQKFWSHQKPSLSTPRSTQQKQPIEHPTCYFLSALKYLNPLFSEHGWDAIRQIDFTITLQLLAAATWFAIKNYSWNITPHHTIQHNINTSNKQPLSNHFYNPVPSPMWIAQIHTNRQAEYLSFANTKSVRVRYLLWHGNNDFTLCKLILHDLFTRLNNGSHFMQNTMITYTKRASLRCLGRGNILLIFGFDNNLRISQVFYSPTCPNSQNNPEQLYHFPWFGYCSTMHFTSKSQNSITKLSTYILAAITLLLQILAYGLYQKTKQTTQETNWNHRYVNILKKTICKVTTT